jgi:hypothetical protein
LKNNFTYFENTMPTNNHFIMYLEAIPSNKRPTPQIVYTFTYIANYIQRITHKEVNLQDVNDFFDFFENSVTKDDPNFYCTCAYFYIIKYLITLNYNDIQTPLYQNTARNVLSELRLIMKQYFPEEFAMVFELLDPLKYCFCEREWINEPLLDLFCNETLDN